MMSTRLGWTFPVVRTRRAHARHRLLYHNAGLFQELFQLLGKAMQSQLVRQLEYLRVENQVLRSRLTKRVLVTPSERRRLLRFGRVLGKDLKSCSPSSAFRPSR